MEYRLHITGYSLVRCSVLNGRGVLRQKRAMLKLSDYICVLIPYGLLNSRTITFTLGPTRFSTHVRLWSPRHSPLCLLLVLPHMHTQSLYSEKSVAHTDERNYLARSIRAQPPRIYVYISKGSWQCVALRYTQTYRTRAHLWSRM